MIDIIKKKDESICKTSFTGSTLSKILTFCVWEFQMLCTVIDFSVCYFGAQICYFHFKVRTYAWMSTCLWGVDKMNVLTVFMYSKFGSFLVHVPTEVKCF